MRTISIVNNTKKPGLAKPLSILFLAVLLTSCSAAEKTEFTTISAENILGYGFIGLAFLLAFFSFNLLKKEQDMPAPRIAILVSIVTFMLFSIVLASGGVFLEYKGNLYKIRLQAISDIIDEKIKLEVEQSRSPAVKALLNQLESQLKQARNDQLIN